jgi:hypothetical protein
MCFALWIRRTTFLFQLHRLAYPCSNQREARPVPDTRDQQRPPRSSQLLLQGCVLVPAHDKLPIATLQMAAKRSPIVLRSPASDSTRNTQTRHKSNHDCAMKKSAAEPSNEAEQWPTTSRIGCFASRQKKKARRRRPSPIAIADRTPASHGPHHPTARLSSGGKIKCPALHASPGVLASSTQRNPPANARCRASIPPCRLVQ